MKDSFSWATLKGVIKVEILDIVDEYGEPTGKTACRNIIHEQGLPHRTSHVWIIRKHNNKTQIIIQKRSSIKDCYPNCYDISSAGHIPAGSDYKESALRELREELGVIADPSELIFIGYEKGSFSLEFYGKMFKDNQISKVFLLKKDVPLYEFTLQQEEVSKVKWIDIDECIDSVKEERFPNCISLNELYMIKNWCDNNL